MIPPHSIEIHNRNIRKQGYCIFCEIGSNTTHKIMIVGSVKKQ